MILLLLRLFCLFSFPIFAQQDDDEPSSVAKVEVYVDPDPFGNVVFQLYLSGFDSHKGDALLKAVPASLGCQWTTRHSEEDELEGQCKRWLNPAGETSGKLRLAPFVQTLLQNGAVMVSVNFLQPDWTRVKVPSGWLEGQGRTSGSLFFLAAATTGLPAELTIPLPPRASASQLLVPVIMVLFIPGLIAYWVRLRAYEASDSQKVNWVVWLNWLNVSTWLYWISTINSSPIGALAERLGITNSFVELLLAVAVYSLPPLVAIAACFTAMAPLLSSTRESFRFLLRRQLVAESVMLVPLAIFITGSGVRERNPTLVIGSLILAYVVYRLLVWVNWRMNIGDSVTLDGGPVCDRVMALARKAGVTIARVTLIRTRVPEEANAFATSGDVIGLTESLVKGLTPRELDAVIAHELGHHKSGHLRFDLGNTLLVVYILVAGPLLGWFFALVHAPGWFVMLPLGPLLFIVLQGLLSQRMEYGADARAVEITADPEGTIAALGRLSKLSRIPVQSGGMMGSIMSHPSMDTRVLALARRFQVPEERALAIVRDPDSAYSGPIAPVATTLHPGLTEHTSPAIPTAFGVRERVTFQEQLSWMEMLVPLLAMAPIFYFMPPILLDLRWRPAVGLAVALLVLALMIRIEVWWSARFFMRLRGRLHDHLHPVPDAVFAGIHPGHGVICTDGFYDWDYGFISLQGDWLCYRGEKATFAVPRQDILRIEVVKGRVEWLRENRVQVVYRGGAFTLSTDFARPAKAAPPTADGLRRWVAEATSRRPVGPPPEHGPALPVLPGMTTSRIGSLFRGLFAAIKLLLASTALFAFVYRWAPGIAMMSLYAPLFALIRRAPMMIWPVRRPPQPVEPYVPASPLEPEVSHELLQDEETVLRG